MNGWLLELVDYRSNGKATLSNLKHWKNYTISLKKNMNKRKKEAINKLFFNK